METRERVLVEIKRLAEGTGQTPGREYFEKEKGIRTADWYGVHWRSWGDAVAEAGLQANELNGKMRSEDVLRAYAQFAIELGRLPTSIDLRMRAKQKNGFPSHTTFYNHFGSKANLVAEVRKCAEHEPELRRVLALLPTPAVGAKEPKPDSTRDGYVYLLRSDRFYKVGRSDNVERRLKEVRIAMPAEVTLIHTIKTDDPSGIESYWHRRFATKRMNGEWFDLAASDVRAFKRRKFQ